MFQFEGLTYLPEDGCRQTEGVVVKDSSRSSRLVNLHSNTWVYGNTTNRGFIIKKTLSVALVLLVVCTFGSAHAALQNNGGGLVYDSDLDITWYCICGAGNIPVWADALAWAAGLNVGGVTGWRLPTTPGTINGYTTEGELGHLFSELGGVLGSQLLNYSPFDCSVSTTFWTSTDYAPNCPRSSGCSPWGRTSTMLSGQGCKDTSRFFYCSHSA